MRDKELWAKIEVLELVSVQELFRRPMPYFGGKFDATQAKSGILAAVIGFLYLLPTLAGNIYLMSVAARSFGKTPDHIKAAIILELRRFLYLLAISGESLVPSQYVAMALVETVDKHGEDLLKRLDLGDMSLSPLRAQVMLSNAYARTVTLRAEEFGEEDPEHIWPKGLAMKLQTAGWIALAMGSLTFVLSRLGVISLGWSILFLIFGGFLYFTEGPWPLSLPFRQSFMAKLRV